ncbi:MAG: hypothetical protein AB8C46_19770 [Burkholderiaceae bacterium]
MNANTIAAQGYELVSRRPQDAKAPGKSLFRRIFEKMAANAERQAMARLAAADPRMAAELRAASDRHEAQALI